MASPRVRAAVVAGLFTLTVLGIVWTVVVLSLPKQKTSAINPAEPEAQAPHTEAPTRLPPPALDAPSTPPLSTPPSRRNTPARKEPFAPLAGPMPEATIQRPPGMSRNEGTSVAQGMSPHCMAELERLCPGTGSGPARRQCVQDNENTLSRPCRQQLDAMASRITEDMQRFKAACRGDVKRFCRRAQPGGGGILQCLEEHYEEVSDACYQALRIRPNRQ